MPTRTNMASCRRGRLTAKTIMYMLASGEFNKVNYIYNILRAIDITNNPKRIVFLEIPEKSQRASAPSRGIRTHIPQTKATSSTLGATPTRLLWIHRLTDRLAVRMAEFGYMNNQRSVIILNIFRRRRPARFPV